MPSFSFDIADVNRLLGILTWDKVFLLVVFIFILALTWGIYENKDTIYGFMKQQRIETSVPQLKSLSKITIEEIDNLVRKSELIVGLTVTLADFQKNQRIVVYRNDELPEMKKLIATYRSKSMGNLPLFSDDVDNNHYIVSLINGEFICLPFAKSTLGKIIPEASPFVNTICYNGIPASYGKFTGIISIQLSRQPTNTEIDQVRVITRSLATAIFDRDLSSSYN